MSDMPDNTRPSQRSRKFIVPGGENAGPAVTLQKPRKTRVFVHPGAASALPETTVSRSTSDGGSHPTVGAEGTGPSGIHQPQHKRKFVIPGPPAPAPSTVSTLDPGPIISPPVRRREFAMVAPRSISRDPPMEPGGGPAHATVPQLPVQNRQFVKLAPPAINVELPPEVNLPQKKRSFILPAETPQPTLDTSRIISSPMRSREFVAWASDSRLASVGASGIPEKKRTFVRPSQPPVPTVDPPSIVGPPVHKRQFVSLAPTAIPTAPPTGLPTTPGIADAALPKRKRDFVLPPLEPNTQLKPDSSVMHMAELSTPPRDHGPARKLGEIEGSPDSTLDLPLPVAVDQIINEARPVNTRAVYYSPPPEARRLMVRNICQRHNGPLHPLVGYHSAKSPSDMDFDRLDYPAVNFRPPLDSSFTEQQLDNVHCMVKTANFQMSTYQEKLQFVRGARMTQLEWELNNINTFSDIGKELDELHEMLLPWVR